MNQEESYPFIAIETRDPKIIAAVFKSFKTQPALWSPYLQAAIHDFSCMDDCAMPHSQAAREVYENIKVVVQIPMPLNLDMVVEADGVADQ